MCSCQMFRGTYLSICHPPDLVPALLQVNSEGDGCLSDPKLPLTSSPHFCTHPFKAVQGIS
jgi:hypothetical protein